MIIQEFKADYDENYDDVDHDIVSMSPAEWYAVKIYAGQESYVAERLTDKMGSSKLSRYFHEVLVAKKSYNVVKNGQNMKIQKVIWSGYIFVRVNFSEEVRSDIRSIRGVFDFVGGSFPSRVSDKNIEEIKMFESEEVEDYVSKKFKEGESVIISNGPLAKTPAVVVKTLPDGKVKVKIIIFGRSNCIDLDWDQVESE
ncbi:MAG: hypothetical protein KAH32_02180 [Chlamydiia bacterium]|nr:hypothetical protein [Chlamydiia bacterium]